MTDLVIYGTKGSPFVRKVEIVLAEKGVPFELENVLPFRQPDWFHEISPARRVPVLRDRSVGKEGKAGTIPDSSAICAYLERRFPEPALYPADDYDYARALFLEEFCDSELGPRVGMGMFRPMIFPRMSGKEPEVEKARETLHEKFPRFFDYFEGELEAGAGAYLVADAFSIADIALATQLVNIGHAAGWVDGSKWPRLAAFDERMRARPSIAACVESELALFPPFDFRL